MIMILVGLFAIPTFALDNDYNPYPSFQPLGVLPYEPLSNLGTPSDDNNQMVLVII
jgi:hypothetical protein